MAFNDIAVAGAGAWGTALALTCARAGRAVTLYEHDARNAAHLARHRESLFLPGAPIDDTILLATDLAVAAEAEAILLVVPAQSVRAAATALGPSLDDGTPVIVDNTKDKQPLGPSVGAFALVPLAADDGRPIGIFCVVDSVPREWTASDIAVLTEHAAAAATDLALRRRLAGLRSMGAAHAGERRRLGSAARPGYPPRALP